MTTIAVLCGYYLPGYKSGGPIRSLANLVDRLGDEINFAIITSDRDLGDSAPYPNVKVDTWNQLGKARVYYLSGSRRRGRSLVTAVREARPDVLYMNSFFSPRYTIGPLVLYKLGVMPQVPVIVAPRGEFSPGALAIKTFRKRAYLALARLMRLYKDVVWQASATNEADDIRRQFGSDTRIIVAPNLTSAGCIPGGSAHERKKKAGHLRALFLSRISPKKNLVYALEVLRQVRGKVALDIYGPIEDMAYWKRCRAVINTLPPNVSVDYRGSVPSVDVSDVMSHHDLLILPTLGENFGHVIVEALSAGCPVLISDQTPWRNLQQVHAGWELPLASPERFGEALDAFAAMDDSEFMEWSEGARRLGRSVSEGLEPLEQNRQLLTLAARAAGHASEQRGKAAC